MAGLWARCQSAGVAEYRRVCGDAGDCCRCCSVQIQDRGHSNAARLLGRRCRAAICLRSRVMKAVGRLALLWRGDDDVRRQATADNNRWREIFAALKAVNIDAEPAVYCEELANEVRDQLLTVDGVLVWVDPISDGRTRFELDAMLRDVASRGVWISTHPDVTLKMGVKEVLYNTRMLGWGTDTHLYRSLAVFREEFPGRLRSSGPRVIKQNRGNGGQGVWKVEVASAGLVSVLEARRGSELRSVALDAFITECAGYFAGGGCVIDQPFQARLTDGMIRCYMGTDKVAGFGHQKIKALIPPQPEGPDAPAAQ